LLVTPIGSIHGADGDQNRPAATWARAAQFWAWALRPLARPALQPIGRVHGALSVLQQQRLTSIVFNESEVLRSFTVSVIMIAPDPDRVWYNDEHALTLGIRSVIVKTTSGSSQ